MTLDDLRARFVAADLELLVPHVERLARRSIRLHPTPVDAVPLGASRVGGAPDALVGFVWPTYADVLRESNRHYDEYQGVPLVFLGQVNWASLGPFDFSGLLPNEGGLLLFAGEAIICAHAVTYDGDAVLAPVAAPKSEDVLPLHALEPQAEWTLPTYGWHGTGGGGQDQKCFWDVLWPDLEFLPLDRNQERAYDQIRGELSGPRPRHRVLGHADYEQNPVHFALECPALGADLGRNWFELSDADNPLTQRIKRSAIKTDWQLLFQVDYFGDSAVFGDGGTYHLFIKHADLAARNWNIVAEMQCG